MLETEGFVTIVTAGQLFGLKLDRVRDVFVPRGLSHVPLAPPEVAGLLNLRGRIVTAIDLRRRLGLTPREDGMTPLAIGIEKHGELYGIIVDKAGDVLRLDRSTFEPNQSRRRLGFGLRRRASARNRPDGRARRRQGARSRQVPRRRLTMPSRDDCS